MELIKIKNENGFNLVSARDLHVFLESKQDFTTWIKNRIDKYEFVEDEDFTLHKFMEGKNWKHDYILKLDMAKELSMVENNEKGKEARKYFIECEKQLKSQFKVPTTMKEALLLALEQQEQIEKLEAKQLEDKPKVEFYNDVTESKDTIDMATVAKVLNIKNIGRNKLFEILRDKKVLMQNNQPYQKYIDNGWFRQIESKWTKPNGDIGINIKTVVFQKGVNGIRKIIGDCNGI